jgi:exodeoxyribonuclease VII large subunit
VNVQGATAAAEVVRGIEGFNNMETPPDLIIVARGGGSFEDLMPFNDENVVRAAAHSVIPLISAVGHETDITLIDFAADVRAPTPTGAAEIAVPVRDDIYAQVLDWGHRMFQCTLGFLKHAHLQVDHASSALSSPARVLEAPTQRVDRLSLQIDHAFEKLLSNADRKLSRISLRTPADVVQSMALKLQHAASRLKIDLKPHAQNVQSLSRTLESLSFRKVLDRGFAVIRDANGALVSKKSALTANQDITITFSDGDAQAKIK